MNELIKWLTSQIETNRSYMDYPNQEQYPINYDIIKGRLEAYQICLEETKKCQTRHDAVQGVDVVDWLQEEIPVVRRKLWEMSLVNWWMWGFRDKKERKAADRPVDDMGAVLEWMKEKVKTLERPSQVPSEE